MRLRNLFLAVLLCFLGPCTAYPAWEYNGTSNTVTMADNATLDFQGDPFAISCWFKPNVATGWASDRGLWYREDSGGDGSMEAEVDQAAGSANYQKFQIYSNSYANGHDMTSSPTAPWSGITAWTHVFFTRTSSNYVFYVNNTQVISVAAGSVDPSTNWTGQWEWGATGGNEWWGGGQAECAMWARELTTEERAGLAAGFSPDCYPNGRVILTPAIGQYIEIESGVAITNNGTTISAHPRIISCR